MKFEYIEYQKKASDEELIDDLRRVALKNGLESMSMNEYAQYGNFDCSTITRRFGTWNNALQMANIEIKNRAWTEQELFDNLENVWIRKGCQPVRRDMDNKQISSISNGAYLRKYGKWSEALKVFVNYINQNDNGTEEISVDDYVSSHRIKRDINLRLRFRVMQRDSFKCCACGASPAKDPSVVLHVDHIISWAKGGETEIDNLQTLCSNCNWGKGNIL